jgi:hypothetical protein
MFFRMDGSFGLFKDVILKKVWQLKKLILIILASILFFAFMDYPKEKLVGLWAEHWGVGVQTDVTYVDTVQIQLSNNGEIEMKCINDQYYLYDKISFNGTELSYRKENASDPNEKFYIYYKLKINCDGNCMDDLSLIAEIRLIM